MPNLTQFIILGLATFRIASLFVNEDGPFRVFRSLREATEITHDESGRVLEIPDNFFAQLLSCVWCASIWVGTGMTIFWLIFPFASVAFSLPFALSAVAVIIEAKVRQ